MKFEDVMFEEVIVDLDKMVSSLNNFIDLGDRKHSVQIGNLLQKYEVDWLDNRIVDTATIIAEIEDSVTHIYKRLDYYHNANTTISFAFYYKKHNCRYGINLARKDLHDLKVRIERFKLKHREYISKQKNSIELEHEERINRSRIVSKKELSFFVKDLKEELFDLVEKYIDYMFGVPIKIKGNEWSVNPESIAKIRIRLSLFKEQTVYPVPILGHNGELIRDVKLEHLQDVHERMLYYHEQIIGRGFDIKKHIIGIEDIEILNKFRTNLKDIIENKSIRLRDERVENVHPIQLSELLLGEQKC